jgi:hypothetical protein
MTAFSGSEYESSKPMSCQVDLFGNPLQPEPKTPPPTKQQPAPVKEIVNTDHIPRRPYTVYKEGKDYTTIWHVDSL